jgi:hypothetical protein
MWLRLLWWLWAYSHNWSMQKPLQRADNFTATTRLSLPLRHSKEEGKTHQVALLLHALDNVMNDPLVMDLIINEEKSTVPSGLSLTQE